MKRVAIHYPPKGFQLLEQHEFLDLPPVTEADVATARRLVAQSLVLLNQHAPRYYNVELAASLREEHEVAGRALSDNPAVIVAHFETMRRLVRLSAVENERGLALARRVRHAISNAMDLVGPISWLPTHAAWYALHN